MTFEALKYAAWKANLLCILAGELRADEWPKWGQTQKEGGRHRTGVQGRS